MNINQRINAVMRDVRGVEKSDTNRHGGYKYAGHEAVTEAIRGAMVQHGIVQSVSTEDLILHDGGHISLAVHITWSCTDEDSSVSGTVHALQHAQTRDGKPTAQQIGQALSYAVKNFTFKTLMLTGDPDADSDAGPLEMPQVDRATQAQADELLAGYEYCGTLDAVTEHGKKIAEWGKVDKIPGLRDSLVKAKSAAQKRIRGGA